ncbi:MAG: aspartate carbamoyltransferase catalytic subunit [bacterium]|nr:aspartate carbamoyltransferase catalytic subunit [bacterium]
MKLNRKDILAIKELKKDEIELILDTAESFREVAERDIKKVPTLRGKTVINLFFEASTRTRSSFEIAGKRMSADVINISASTSSTVKGETLIDTAKNLQAMNPDIIVLRHPSSGAPALIASQVNASIINAGDGCHEHPSQALLDLLTIRQAKGRVAGLRVAIIGDIAHSRVARSNIYGLKTMGAEVAVAGLPTMIPCEIEKMGVKVFNSIDAAIEGADVIMMLRIQKERMDGPLFPTEREYSMLFGLNSKRLEKAKKDVAIMHPGPINRGVEISPDVVDGPSSVILNQVANGLAVRMALLFLLSGGRHEVDA